MKAKLKATRFDERFDDGKSVLEDLDVGAARRVKHEQKRVNVDFPTWMIELLDMEASRIGVTRQSIIKIWLAERLEKASSNHSVQADQPVAGR